jgi:hypothetical protein
MDPHFRGDDRIYSFTVYSVPTLCLRGIKKMERFAEWMKIKKISILN